MPILRRHDLAIATTHSPDVKRIPISVHGQRRSDPAIYRPPASLIVQMSIERVAPDTGQALYSDVDAFVQNGRFTARV